MSKIMARFAFLKYILLQGVILTANNFCSAATKTSSQSGNWTSSSTWSPAGVPAAGDNVVISGTHSVTIDNNKSVQNLTVNSGGTLLWTSGKRITINGNFTVNGTATMNKGEITLSSPGLSFTLGPNAVFTWDPGTNNSSNATLFTRGVENFSATSTLIIKNWYNYSIALGSVITGNFGNLTMNSPSGGGSIVEWNQKNEFQTHQIQGTLTIDQGWVTLDKTKSITDVTIGNLVLTSVNSVFYGHSGTHLSSFSITFGSVTNNGGIFYGLSNGNGDVTINVLGNFTNIGNVKIINNDGVAGVCNGNATFNVGGTFQQSTGDTRIIYNITTTLSGTFNSTINNLNLTGGIFMGQTGCHILGNTSTLTITNNCTINFSSPANKFRCTSLSTIGGVLNNVKVNFTVGGNLVFSGPGTAEFTSTASAGTETVLIGGNLQINGGVMGFNYGTSAASHDVTLQINGDLIVSGGTCYLSRNSGTSAVTIGGNISITSGILVVKGASGTGTLDLSGNFLQSGGTLYLHSNGTMFTPNPVTMNVNGAFSQSSGIFTYDDNTSNSSAVHTLNIKGPQYTISGTGSITHAGPGSCSVFGLLRFAKAGTQLYSRSGNTHSMKQVKMEIEAGSTLNIGAGNLVLSSGNTQATDFLKIKTGGILKLNSNQILSEGSYTYSGIQIDSGGTLSLQSSYGLYDGTGSAALSANGNMNFYLDENSIIEYTGTNNQTITGTGSGLATTANHQYGILRIKKTSEVAHPVQSNVTVRTQLQLDEGELRLNGNILTLLNGASTAITRNNGYILSEQDGSILYWKNLNTGLHEIPFGLSSTTYIPVSITPVSGTPADMQISTRGTGTDNKPFPSVAGIHLQIDGQDVSDKEVIDRWWSLNSPGLQAHVTLRYPASENTLVPEFSSGVLGILSWQGNKWGAPQGSGMGVHSGIGAVTINNASHFSNWIIASNSTTLPIELAYFNAKVSGNEVLLSWATASEINNSFFTVERSTDGINYNPIQQVNGAGNSTTLLTYGVTDKNPIDGLSYYRLKQTDFDGKFTFSEVEVVHYSSTLNDLITINDASPNPFEDHFVVSFSTPQVQDIEFLLMNSSGQIIKKENIHSHEGTNQYTYADAAGLNKGIYFINLICKDKKLTKKIIKN